MLFVLHTPGEFVMQLTLQQAVHACSLFSKKDQAIKHGIVLGERKYVVCFFLVSFRL